MGTVVASGQVDLVQLHSPAPLTNGVALAQRHCLMLTGDARVQEPGALPRPGLTNTIAVASGDGHALALQADGVVVAWGDNTSGQTNVPPAATNVIGIAAGQGFSLALRSDGTVVGWGYQADAPVGLSNVIAVAAGQTHALALRADGSVIAWGNNAFGQCSVPAGLGGVTAIAGGNTHTLALRADGTVVGWGAGGNDQGQTNSPPNATNVVAIAAGGFHSLALRADGRIIGWGWNGFGQLNLPDNGTNYIAIAAGPESSFALTRLPVILAQPVGQTVLAGTNVAMTVGAVGTGTWGYQWLFGPTNLVGQTAISLSLTNVQVEDSGTYSVALGNTFGAAVSAPASLVVQPNPPSVIVQPTNQSRVVGGTATFAVAATGASPLAYQWFFNGGGLPGATNSSLSLTNLADFNAGRYQAAITNRYGTNSSATAILTVNAPPSVSTTPTNLMLTAGANFILQASATGTPPLRYQWLFQGNYLAGATNLSLVLTNLQAANAGQYSLVVSNAYGVVTNPLCLLSVADSAPVIYTQPVSQLFLPGSLVVLKVGAFGTAPLTYQWWWGTNLLAVATNASLLFSNIQPSNAGTYVVTVSNSFGVTNSQTATLSVGDPYPGQVDSTPFVWTLAATNTVSSPTCITHAGDGSGRLFVAEQAGRIRILQGNTVLTTPFLNIVNRVRLTGVLGLQSIAFSPGFATNRQFYTYYTRKSDSAMVLSRFLVTTNANLVDTNTEQVVLTILQPGGTDIGGTMAFGPDGYLYLGVGDGDVFTNAQSPTSILGKILRIDVEGGIATYRVPASNPFVTNGLFPPEAWAVGVRSPWAITFDRLTGDLYIPDAGNTYQESNFQSAGSAGGQNYGWPIRDGPVAYQQPPGYDTTNLTGPVAWYGGMWSLVGGFVYRGPYEPRMTGYYFFANMATRQVWSLKQNATNWVQNQVAQPPFTISIFGEDQAGQLYIADYYGGRIYAFDAPLSLTLTPAGGSFTTDQKVIAATLTPGASIHYTTDGRDPTVFDPVVASGGGIAVATDLTLKARAFRDDLLPSAVVTANFSFRVQTPSLSPASGPITNKTLLTMTCGTPGATVRYTLDGADPSQSSPLYIAPVLINGGTTVLAKAFRAGYAASAINNVYFDWLKVTTPVITPEGGVITNGTLAVANCALAGAAIHYTTDGSVPTLASSLYTNPFPVFGNSTLQLRAWLLDYAPSDILTVKYDLLDYEPTVVENYAGQGTAGFADGPALAALFNGPQGVCVTPLGDVYVADTGNNRIRRVLPAGQVRTVAGSGTAGRLDGTGTNATFSAPTGVGLDATGNLYVADSGNNLLRKITPDGSVSTLADLAASPWQTPVLWQLAVETNGNLYVSGWLDVFKVNPSGNFSVFAGPGWCCPPDWSDHIGLALDGGGGVFATINRINTYGRVVHLSPAGAYSVYAGDAPGYTDGPRQIARFVRPLALATDTENGLLVSDFTRVRKILPNGRVTTLAGTGATGYLNGRGAAAAFNQLGAVAVDMAGNIFVADSGNHCIRRIQRDSFGIGIPDAWQLAHFGQVGIDPNGDSDHDGITNWQEYVADTDPVDASSALRFVRTDAGPAGVRVSWSGGTAARRYLEWLNAISATNQWSILSIEQPPTTTTNSYLDAGRVTGSGFYRIRVERP